MKSLRRGLSHLHALWLVVPALLAFAVSPAIGHPGHPTNDPSPALQPREEGPALLTDEDIELLKVYEVHMDSDPAPRVAIPRDVLQQFLREFQEDDRIPRGEREQQAWIRGDGVEQLRLMFQLRARDYYKHVRIRSQVESLRAWSRVHRSYIQTYFQPTFGGGKVPALYLFQRGRETDRIEMTNFYILTQTSIDGKPMIDRNNPEQSLLLQWGLPRESAKFPAPDIEGWRPEFRSVEDQDFKQMVEWIRSLIRENQGSNYGIEYQIPRNDPRRGN